MKELDEKAATSEEGSSGKEGSRREGSNAKKEVDEKAATGKEGSRQRIKSMRGQQHKQEIR